MGQERPTVVKGHFKDLKFPMCLSLFRLLYQKYHQQAGLNNNHLFLNSEAGKSKIKVPEDWMSHEGLLPCS